MSEIIKFIIQIAKSIERCKCIICERPATKTIIDLECDYGDYNLCEKHTAIKIALSNPTLAFKNPDGSFIQIEVKKKILKK